jgi:uncharacterized protein involved in exopolysaccharide biosynthesis
MPEPAARPPSPDEAQEQNLRLVEVGIALAENLRLLVAGPLAAGLLALALTYAFKPTYTARTSLLPPQQQNQNAAASALASLGALGNAAGAAATLRTPGDQYLALLQSTTIADRLISEFKLMEVYDEDNLVDTRRKLDRRVDMSVGKKDGLITIEVDDKDPTRAAAMARRYVDELRRLTSRLALTEAQQRRVFFEAQLAEARDRLTQAQLILQGSGFGAGALRAEPRAAAEAYARVKAEVTATEIRLQVLRRSLADHTPEVQQQLSVLAALRSQLARLETVPEAPKDPDYVGRFREFKYQEALFETLARQYESARLDEAREGALIQVVDEAQVPDKKSWPKRGLTAAGVTLASFVALLWFVLRRQRWQQTQGDPEVDLRVRRLRSALGRR